MGMNWHTPSLTFRGMSSIQHYWCVVVWFAYLDINTSVRQSHSLQNRFIPYTKIPLSGLVILIGVFVFGVSIHSWFACRDDWRWAGSTIIDCEYVDMAWYRMSSGTMWVRVNINAKRLLFGYYIILWHRHPEINVEMFGGVATRRLIDMSRIWWGHSNSLCRVSGRSVEIIPNDFPFMR